MNVSRVELNLVHHKLQVNKPEITNFIKRLKLKWNIERIFHVKDDLIEFRFCQN
jgi:hypothetical protein